MTRTERFTLHVPLALNDGSPADPSVLDDVESAILAAAGGFTLTTAVGAWQGEDGTVYREPIRLYLVDGDASVYGVLVQAAEVIRAAFEQEAVYLTRQVITPRLVTATAA